MRFVSQMLCLLVAWLSLGPSMTKADMVLTIDNLLARPGETVLVGVYASSNIGDIISGFNLPLDFGADGFVDPGNDGVSDLPVNFALNAVPLRQVVYGNTGLDRPFPQVMLINVDTIPTGSGGNIVLGPNPTRLFDLAINVSPLAQPGDTLPLVIKLPDAPFSSLFNIAGPNSPIVTLLSPGIVAAGSITVIGVPEPTTLAFISLGLCGGLGYWKSKRRSGRWQRRLPEPKSR